MIVSTGTEVAPLAVAIVVVRNVLIEFFQRKMATDVYSVSVSVFPVDRTASRTAKVVGATEADVATPKEVLDDPLPADPTAA
jgi:hypothetical protein